MAKLLNWISMFNRQKIDDWMDGQIFPDSFDHMKQYLYRNPLFNGVKRERERERKGGREREFLRPKSIGKPIYRLRFD